MLAKAIYVTACVVGILAIFMLQNDRYRYARGCRWWLYSALSAGLAWEALDALTWGAPGFPATRWITTPALAAILAWAAIEDWQRGRDTQ